ncbi:MAG: hypothetical protein AAFU71_05265, partial [Cyanobacteria bacterium J06632_22]
LPESVELCPENTPQNSPLGPLTALAQFLQSYPPDTPWLLLLACDWVGLSTASLQAGCQQLSTLPPSTDAYLPSGIKGWEPLHGFYRVATLQRTVPSTVAQGTRAFQAWLSNLTVTPWALDTAQLINCNTKQDWQHAQQKQASNRPASGG